MLSRASIGRLPIRPLRWSSARFQSTSLRGLPFKVAEEVAEALNASKPVVALESAIITHGMPYPLNYETALKCEQIIRSTGAIPATIGMISGQIHVGLTTDQVERLADESNTNKVKLSRRDLAPAMALGVDGGTTIAGTMVLAHLAGIKVFSTGGLGGVHRGGENSMDISADLTELGRTPVAVVSAGAKSILDLGRTLEYLETQGVTVTTYGKSKDFPAFFSRLSGFKSPYSIDSPQLAAKMLFASHQLQLESGALIACPIPEEYEAEGLKIQKFVDQAVRESEENGVAASGKDATPWLLRRVMELSRGLSLNNNVALIENTSRIGGLIAVEYAKLIAGSSSSSIPAAPYPHPPVTPTSSSPLSSLFSPAPSKQSAKLVVVGAAAVDVIATTGSSSSSTLMTHSTVPGSIQTSLGGVARNMAEAAHRSLGGAAVEGFSASTMLVSPIGNDSFGELIQLGMRSISMRTDGLLLSSPKESIESASATSSSVLVERRSPVCNMVLSASGDLLGGVADFSALDTLTSNEVLEVLDGSSPALLALDGNAPTWTIQDLVGHAYGRNIPVWFEPTSIAKSTRILPAIRSVMQTQPVSSTMRAPVAYVSPNVRELQHLFQASREPLVEAGREVPPLTSLDAWFAGVDALGLQAGISSDAFARLGGREGEFLSKEGIIQMCVQLLPFFQHLIVKCGEKGVFVAMRISPAPSDRAAWIAASSVPISPSRPFVHTIPNSSDLLVLRWYPAHTLTTPIVNVTGAGDSLVGSLLASIIQGEMAKEDPFCHPGRLDEVMRRAQGAAVLSLQSTQAVAPELSNARHP
ncbi:hypothetical protein DL93DRAFT_2090328 [Clavulina sp. PMI_390]|nr:hypothetical protein DL93DRAFT_2090328 [Clavulina sp. PMI_390]